MSAENQGAWGLVGKASVLIALIMGVFALYDWMTKPSTSVHADIEAGDTHLPPKYKNLESKMTEILSAENVSKSITDITKKVSKENSETDWSPISTLLAISLRDQLGVSNPYVTALAFKDTIPYWRGTITNTGDLAVKDVSLRLPDFTIAVVINEDGTTVADTAGPIIEIESIKPRQVIKFTAWNDKLVTIETDNEPTLHHAGGPGSVRIINEMTLANYARQNKSTILLFMLLFFTVIAYLFVTIFNERQAKRIANEMMQKLDHLFKLEGEVKRLSREAETQNNKE